MSSRQRILDKIRQVKQEEKALPKDLPQQMQYHQNLLDQFRFSCSVTGTGLYDFDSMDDAVAFFQNKAGNSTAFAGPGIGADQSVSDPTAVEFALLMGSFGVAENNAIWLSESRMGHRVIPFVCQHLFLLLNEAELIPDMHAAYQRAEVFSEGFGVFIAGPSKTADIEQSLVIGAHGPLSLDVLIVH